MEWRPHVIRGAWFEVADVGAIRPLGTSVPLPTRMLGGQSVVEIDGVPHALDALVDEVFPPAKGAAKKAEKEEPAEVKAAAASEKAAESTAKAAEPKAEASKTEPASKKKAT